MKIELVKKEKNKLKIAVNGESHTITQLLAATASAKADVASVQEHPTESPRIIVHATNPKKVLENAATDIIAQCKDLKKEFSRALKK